MSTNGTSSGPQATTAATIGTLQIGAPGAPEQLSLLVVANVPLQFRLDERTRRSGLQHVAALRAQIAAQAAARNLSPSATVRTKPQRQIAA